MAAPWAIFCKRDIFDSCRLAAVVDATMRLSRLRGSAIWLARLASSSATWLPHSSPALSWPCSDTGTIAVKSVLRSAARDSRWRRSAAAQIASVRSLTVAPVALPICRSRSSEYDCAAKRREPVISVLSGVGGASQGVVAPAAAWLPRTYSHRPLPTPGRISPVARAASTADFSSRSTVDPPGTLARLTKACAHSGGFADRGLPKRTVAIE